MKHVLIVDDDYDICESLKMILEDRYRVSIARNGVEALRVLEREPVDAVVLDLMMPLLDGESTLREVRARGWTVPVIIASAATHLPARASTSGAVAWLQKPFNVGDLENALTLAVREPNGGGHSPNPSTFPGGGGGPAHARSSGGPQP
jgi:DNA-binding response OmpR family regulator